MQIKFCLIPDESCYLNMKWSHRFSMMRNIHKKDKHLVEVHDFCFRIPRMSTINHLVGDSMIRARDQRVCSPVVSGSSSKVANIDGHWRLTWSLTSGSVRISRGASKLARTPHINKRKNIKQSKTCHINTQEQGFEGWTFEQGRKAWAMVFEERLIESSCFTWNSWWILEVKSWFLMPWL